MALKTLKSLIQHFYTKNEGLGGTTKSSFQENNNQVFLSKRGFASFWVGIGKNWNFISIIFIFDHFWSFLRIKKFIFKPKWGLIRIMGGRVTSGARFQTPAAKVGRKNVLFGAEGVKIWKKQGVGKKRKNWPQLDQKSVFDKHLSQFLKTMEIFRKNIWSAKPYTGQ